MSPLEILALTTLLCVTFLITVEMLRRYYTAKGNLEYRMARLEYDDAIFAADGGDDDTEEQP